MSVTLDGRTYTDREYEHIQVVIAETGAPPAYLADTPVSQLPPVLTAVTPYQQEEIERIASITVTEHVYTPPIYSVSEAVAAASQAAEMDRLAAIAATQAAQTAQAVETETFSSVSGTTSTEPQKFLLEIGYIGNPPDWLAARIMNTLQPIAQRIGWTVEAVMVNPATIDIRFAAPSNPIPMILIYAILAVIAAAIAGAVIISIVWTDLKTQELEVRHINDLAEVIQGIAADPNIDAATKRQMLLDLNSAIGSVADHDEAPVGLAGIKDLMLLGIGASVLMSVLKQ